MPAKTKRFQINPASLLLVMSLPFLQPGILAGNTNIGLALVAGALFLAAAADLPKIAIARGSLILWLFMAASGCWLIFRSQFVGTNLEFVITGNAQSLFILFTFGLVLSDRERAIQFGRGFVCLVITLCASYLVTFCIWQVAGLSAGKLADLPLGGFTSQIFFPFTSTISHQSVFDVSFFRFTGLGREPGWMAMFIAVAWFLWPLVGKPRLWARIVMVIGLLGAFSTAGFGVFVVVLAYELFLRRRPAKDAMRALLRQMFGLLVMAGAIWVAYASPVFGLSAKSEQNAESLSQRSDVTQRGLDALLNLSLGTAITYENANLNLIASVALSGWPYLVLILLALLAPRIGHPGASFTTAPIAVITLTLVMAQPPGGSFSPFALAIAIYSVAYFKATPVLDTQAPEPLPRSHVTPRTGSHRPMLPTPYGRGWQPAKDRS